MCMFRLSSWKRTFYFCPAPFCNDRTHTYILLLNVTLIRFVSETASTVGSNHEVLQPNDNHLIVKKEWGIQIVIAPPGRVRESFTGRSTLSLTSPWRCWQIIFIFSWSSAGLLELSQSLFNILLTIFLANFVFLWSTVAPNVSSTDTPPLRYRQNVHSSPDSWHKIAVLSLLQDRLWPVLFGFESAYLILYAYGKHILEYKS